MRRLNLLAVALFLSSGCKVTEEPQPPHWSGPKLYVVNSLAETIGIYIPDSGKYYDAVMTTGTTPNAFVIGSDDPVYLINSGFGGTPSIQVIDLTGDSVLATYPLPEGSNPLQGVKVGEKLYITSWTRGLLYRVDARRGTVEDSLFVGPSLDGIAWIEPSLYVVASFYDQESYESDTGKLYRVDPETWRVTDSLTLGLNPTTVRVGPDRKLYILHPDFTESSLYRVDPEAFTVEGVVATWVGYISGFEMQDTLALFSGWSGPLIVWNLQAQNAVAEIPLVSVEGGLMGTVFGAAGAVYAAIFSSEGENFIAVADISERAFVDFIPTGSGVGTQILRYFP